jgi:hypothetical protein
MQECKRLGNVCDKKAQTTQIRGLDVGALFITPVNFGIGRNKLRPYTAMFVAMV